MLTLNQEWEKFHKEVCDGNVDKREEIIAKFCFYAGMIVLHRRLLDLQKGNLKFKDQVMAMKLAQDELMEWAQENKNDPITPDRIVLE